MTVDGDGYRTRQWDLGRLRWPVAGLVWSGLVIFWILPLGTMVLVSFHDVWLGHVDFGALTFDHYAEVFGSELVRRAFTNSFIIGAVSAIVGTALVTLLAYYTERTTYRFRGLVDVMSLTPLAVPSIILGAAVIFTYLWLGKLVPVFNIYGTIWIIVLGSIVVFIPVTSRIAIGNIVQIHSHLEESARIHGASWLQQLREVFLPLFRTTIGIISFYLFIHVFRLLTIPIMTYTQGTETVSVVIFSQWLNYADVEFVSAMSVVFVSLMFVTILVLRYFGLRFYALR